MSPPADPGGAGALTEDQIVRLRNDRPTEGWRGLLYRMSGGAVNPGLAPLDRERHDRLRRIGRRLPRGLHQIAVTSIKGGVGKTTVTACLGLVMADYRNDRVIALDANPDAGTLADRLTGVTDVNVRTLLENTDRESTQYEIAQHTSLAGRLQVLASEQDPEAGEAFSRDEYARACELVSRFCNIIITDSGTGMVHSAMDGTLRLADSLVVVGSPTVDGAGRAQKTLDWLDAHGHQELVSNAVVVLSYDRRSADVKEGNVRGYFANRCRAVIEVPHDPHLATGGPIALARLAPGTRDAFIGLAALMADGFGARSSGARRRAD